MEDDKYFLSRVEDSNESNRDALEEIMTSLTEDLLPSEVHVDRKTKNPKTSTKSNYSPIQVLLMIGFTQLNAQSHDKYLSPQYPSQTTHGIDNIWRMIITEFKKLLYGTNIDDRLVFQLMLRVLINCSVNFLFQFAIMPPKPTPRPTLLSDLPSELLYLILEKLTGELEDILSCADVCVSWRSVILSFNTHPRRSSPSLILIHTPVVKEEELQQADDIRKNKKKKKKQQEKEEDLHLFNTQRGISHVIHLPQQPSSKRWCHSCSNGMLLRIACEFPHETSLLMPLSRSEIKLPPLGAYGKGFCVISSSIDLSDPDCLVVGAVFHPHFKCRKLYYYTPDLIYCSPQKQYWMNVRVTLPQDRLLWQDIIRYQNQLYAVSFQFLYQVSFASIVEANELIPLPPNEEAIIPPTSETSFYLVQLNGDLVLVLMTIHKGLVIQLKVYKLKSDDGVKIWIEIDNLGGNVIYLGRGCSVAVTAQEECYKDCVIFFVNDVVHRVVLKNGNHSMKPFGIPKSIRPIEWFTHDIR